VFAAESHVTEMPVRVALAGSDAFVRRLTRLVLAKQGVVVVAEAATPEEAVILAGAECPDAVILFTAPGDADGVTTTERIAAQGIPVLVLAHYAAPASAMRLIEAGAAGYLTMQIIPEELVRAAESLKRGATPLDPFCAGPLVAEWRRLRSGTGVERQSAEELSTRELQILRLLADGRSTKAAAAQLSISPKTVENHKTRIFAKLGVRNQAQAVAIALSKGLLGVDGSAEPGTVG
jgi:DNA-binding NarL/FixJ family response regulator